MKKSLLGSFVGLAIIMAIDTFARVIIALYMQYDILMIAYTSYPGLLWPMVLTLVAGFSTFFGAMFSLTYGRTHRVLAIWVFSFLAIGLRYGQLHLLIGQESLFYPITALVLSLGGILLAWHFTKNSHHIESRHHQPAEEKL